MKFWQGFGKGMKDFGELIGTLVNTVLLMVVYIVGVGITAILAKIVSKNFLEKKKKGSETYWNDLDIKTKPIKEYYRQF
jgi:hypothetical protein